MSEYERTFKLYEGTKEKKLKEFQKYQSDQRAEEGVPEDQKKAETEIN